MIALSTIGVFVGGVAVGMCISPAIFLYSLGRDGTRWLAKSLKEYVEEFPDSPERQDAMDRLTKVENDMDALMGTKHS
jgi:hypothetical protein